MWPWDATLGLPIPPADAVAPTFISHVASGAFGLLGLVSFVLAWRCWRNTGRDNGRSILFLILLGGLLTSSVETFVNVVGGCWHPALGQEIVFKFMGRPIPVWIVVTYIGYFGGQGALLYALFQRGATTRLIYLCYFVPMFLDALWEIFVLPTGLWIYGGPQPLMLIGLLPVWWIACNSLGVIVGAALCALCAPYLKGYRLLVIPLLIPMGDMIAYAAVGLPSFIAINTEGLPNWVVQGAGVMTFFLAFLVIRFVSLVIATDSPLRNGARLTLPGEALVKT